jgi:hypothetical protein
MWGDMLERWSRGGDWGLEGRVGTMCVERQSLHMAAAAGNKSTQRSHSLVPST